MAELSPTISSDLGGLPVAPDDIHAAAVTIRGAVVETPCSYSRTLSNICGCDIWLKFENLQFTGSFKERGALVKLASLTEGKQQLKGVIAASVVETAHHAHMALKCEGTSQNGSRLHVRQTLSQRKTWLCLEVSAQVIQAAIAVIIAVTVGKRRRNLML